jgi:aminoglycoside phosphotransferase (APT) family kinase protein
LLSAPPQQPDNDYGGGHKKKQVEACKGVRIIHCRTPRLPTQSSVLDFEGALAGDPLMDVAKALYYLTDEAKTALLEGYGDMGQRRWSQTLDLYHLYFVLELWCWMAQIGNEQSLDKLALHLERSVMV